MPVFERIIRDARGQDVACEVRLARLPFGSGKQIRASYVDITERKRIENAVRESERRLGLLIQAAPVGVVIHAADGRVLQSNPEAGRLLGISDADMRNRGLEHPEWKFVREDGSSMPVEEYPAAQVLTRHEPLRNVVAGVRRPGAEDLRWVLVDAVPLLGPGGGASEVIVMFMDITERKRAEEQMKQEVRRKDEFLAMLGHELRNPLAPIQNASHILKLVGSPDPRAQRAREMIERQVTHMSRMVDDLLDVARIARGKISLRHEALDWARLVHTTANDLRGELEGRGMTLALQLPPKPVYVLGDPTRLAQVVSNILQNAMKFSDQGGRIAVELCPGGGGAPASLTVQDTGIGMTRETLDRIFSPFFQASVDLAGTRGGLGLGLALVKGIVGLHGGTVGAQSEGPGRGTRITVQLPEIEGQPEAPAPSPAPSAGGARSILIVEDNLDAARSLQLMLGLMGHRVRVAPDGPSGLVEARAFRPEIVPQ
jgi:PAS domain S-box-containing protein